MRRLASAPPPSALLPRRANVRYDQVLLAPARAGCLTPSGLSTVGGSRTLRSWPLQCPAASVDTSSHDLPDLNHPPAGCHHTGLSGLTQPCAQLHGDPNPCSAAIKQMLFRLAFAAMLGPALRIHRLENHTVTLLPTLDHPRSCFECLTGSRHGCPAKT